MKITEFCIDNQTTTFVLTFVMVVAGLSAYQKMGRLEDPEFTIKDAVISTRYPGASAEAVEEEITDEIETAVQQLEQLKEVKSQSYRGLSIVTATIKDNYDKETLPQVWDELRRKVADATLRLPPGAGQPFVNDDFGDVYGIFFALYGSEYSFDDLWEVAKLLRRELLLVDGVAKIDIFAEQLEVIYVELDRDRMSQLGISPTTIANELKRQNLVSNAGSVSIGDDFVTIDPTELVSSEADLASILLSESATDAQIYLRDIANIRRGYREPPSQLL